MVFLKKEKTLVNTSQWILIVLRSQMKEKSCGADSHVWNNANDNNNNNKDHEQQH